MAQRLLLCRPQGGLNDMLCQIEVCCRYAELAGRTVVVDTHFSGSPYFQDDFGNYFKSTQSKLKLATGEVGVDLDALSVMPGFLQGRVMTYSPVMGPSGKWSERAQREALTWVDAQTRQPLTFDFTRDHAQELLVHHAYGRNGMAQFALLRLRLKRSVSDELRKRLVMIGPPYDAIHVRHTDYQANYGPALQALRAGPPRKLFLATDNVDVLHEFRAVLGADRVYSFSALPSKAGEPAHKEDLRADDRFARNSDAILDLLLLALARQLVVVKLEGTGPPHSGFSRLAHALWTSKIIIRHLLARDDIRCGLD